MNTKIAPINNPVKLLIVRQKDFNDRAKGYEVLDQNQKWKDLRNINGILLTPTEIIKMATRLDRHILWNPILRRKQDQSVLFRAEKLA